MSAVSRDAIFADIRNALQALPAEARTPYPDYDGSVAVAEPRLRGASLWDCFAANLRAVNGRPMRSAAELAEFLLAREFRHGYCDPALRPSIGDRLAAAGIEVEFHYDRARYDDYQFGITRADGAIAETGTAILTDTHTADRLAALTPWVHVAVFHEADLCRTLGDAIARFGAERNIIFATGPSKTADIEGILIEGVHGPGEQICLCLV